MILFLSQFSIYLLLALAYLCIAWHIPPLILFWTINNIYKYSLITQIFFLSHLIKLSMLIQVLIKNYQNHTVADWDSMGRVVTQARAFQTLNRAFQTLNRAFDFFLSLQKPSIWKGRLSVSKHALGRAFCSTEFMKIWFVKSTVYLLQSSVINVFNLHFISKTYNYSLRH